MDKSLYGRGFTAAEVAQLTEDVLALARTPSEADIRRQLLDLAPYPAAGPVTAVALSRHLAVRAQVIWTLQISRHPGDGQPADPQQLDLLTVLFAAARAILALETVPYMGQLAARQIRDAWEDGQDLGEMLWRILGDETAIKVTRLASELTTPLEASHNIPPGPGALSCPSVALTMAAAELARQNHGGPAGEDDTRLAADVLAAAAPHIRADALRFTVNDDELLNDLLANAGDEWDRDAAAEAIAVEYVRHLEASKAAASEMLATFTQGSDGYRARAGKVQIGRWAAVLDPHGLREEQPGVV